MEPLMSSVNILIFDYVHDVNIDDMEATSYKYILIHWYNYKRV